MAFFLLDPHFSKPFQTCPWYTTQLAALKTLAKSERGSWYARDRLPLRPWPKLCVLIMLNDGDKIFILRWTRSVSRTLPDQT